MKFILTVPIAWFVFAGALSALGQDRVPINEIVARVNGGMITRIEYLNALRDYKESLEREMLGKSKDQIDAEFEKTKSQVLDYLIENILLVQKAKALNIDVEAEVDQRMAEITSLPPLLALQKRRGVNLEEARAQIRESLLQQRVIQHEVLSPILQRLTEKEKLDFYEKHKEDFITNPEISLSEVFLPMTTLNADEVGQRARRLVAELRAGKSFVAAVEENSPPTRASRSRNGKIGTFKPNELIDDIAAAIRSLKVGEITEPLRLSDGFQILRLDDRKPATILPYENPEVQNDVGRALTMEHAEEARLKYMKNLRDEAVVEIAPAYVSPKHDRQ